MKIKKYDIWVANMNPRTGTEVGKNRPVVVVQTDLLNMQDHTSTIVLPITTNAKAENILRVPVSNNQTGLEKPSDVMIDQIRSIDNKRLLRKIGELPLEIRKIIDERLRLILD